MGEKQPVTQGEDITITVQDVEDSEWGSLITARQKIFPTERRQVMLSSWIAKAKNDVIRGCGRTWAVIIADDEMKLEAEQIVLMLVGIKILRRAQAARADVTESDYTRQVLLLEEDIEKRLLNLEVPTSPISISNVEPDMVDPDSDYDYD